MDNNINKELLPAHVAIILDGNGRWAKTHNKPRFLGHRKGALNLRDISVYANKMGIKYLTVYCFSSENWKRPKDEVDYLFTQPIKYYNKHKNKLSKTNIRIKVLGKRDRLSAEFLAIVNEVEETTKNNNGLVLSLCIDYGSIDEIVNATRLLCQDVKDGKIAIDNINEELFESKLYTALYPKLDLLIRTSGEIRISNFLLFQLAYSELYFTDVYWPDFNTLEFDKAIVDYQKRNRRFGGLKEEKK